MTIEANGHLRRGQVAEPGVLTVDAVDADLLVHDGASLGLVVRQVAASNAVLTIAALARKSVHPGSKVYFNFLSSFVRL